MYFMNDLLWKKMCLVYFFLSCCRMKQPHDATTASLNYDAGLLLNVMKIIYKGHAIYLCRSSVRLWCWEQWISLGSWNTIDSTFLVLNSFRFYSYLFDASAQSPVSKTTSVILLMKILPMVADCLKTSRRHFDPHPHSLLLDYNALGYDRPFIFYCHCPTIIILNWLDCFIIFKPFLSILIKNKCQMLSNVQTLGLKWIIIIKKEIRLHSVYLMWVYPHLSPHTYYFCLRATSRIQLNWLIVSVSYQHTHSRRKAGNCTWGRRWLISNFWCCFPFRLTWEAPEKTYCRSLSAGLKIKVNCFNTELDLQGQINYIECTHSTRGHFGHKCGHGRVMFNNIHCPHFFQQIWDQTSHPSVWGPN